MPFTRQDAITRAQLPRAFDAPDAQHPAVARGQGLRRGGGRTQHVDHDRDVGCSQAVPGKRNVNHAASLTWLA